MFNLYKNFCDSRDKKRLEQEEIVRQKWKDRLQAIRTVAYRIFQIKSPSHPLSAQAPSSEDEWCAFEDSVRTLNAPKSSLAFLLGRMGDDALFYIQRNIDKNYFPNHGIRAPNIEGIADDATANSKMVEAAISAEIKNIENVRNSLSLSTVDPDPLHERLVRHFN